MVSQKYPTSAYLRSVVFFLCPVGAIFFLTLWPNEIYVTSQSLLTLTTVKPPWLIFF
jgi:hypothetical protein